ncbi:hypothetical protein DM02DRAFT_626223 [Periconia macrospinosa]|uniref:DUF7053 domain-containing protein n=1 Tax=Periconia macrospinosa TaxID=97972 RepID=A0A2V1DXD0_9PLEO|nr:hypothetical protein DM02DRAFT_626223 [Periconia macrospinosa]
MLKAFNSTDKISLKSTLPGGVTAEKALAVLHDHDFMIRCDRNLENYEDITHSGKSRPKPVDAALKPTASTKCYNIHDYVNNIPGGIVNPKVDSNVEYTNLEDGLFIVAMAPLGVVSSCRWKFEAGELLIDLTFSCSKLLLPMVRSGFKENIEHINDTILRTLSA